MIGIYLIGALLLVLALFLNRNKTIAFVLLGLFLILQATITIYSYSNLNSTEWSYFTYDSLSVLMLITLGIIAVPAIIHSHIYLEDQPAPPESRAVYYGAIVLLITAISAGSVSYTHLRAHETRHDLVCR